MIATILPGSENFHAVGYNEHKVMLGTAHLFEMQNFGAVGIIQPATAEEKIKFLQRYSSRNDRVKKAQFHVAISCKGQEMNETQLLEFAHRYLQEMGYAKAGQPWLIYAHNDTDNLHLHIVTSRVAPDGHKIDHNHERRRSQVVVDKLMGINRGKTTQKDIDAAKQYRFSSFAQFKAIMISMGYEVYNKAEKVYIKKGGKVQGELILPVLELYYQPPLLNKTLNRQLREILKTYRDVSADRDELKQSLKVKLGIDLVFFGRKDAPYGYMLVDHANEQVIHGARILSIEELLDFATPEQRFERIERFVDDLLTINPKTTQDEIFRKLRRQRAYIKKGIIYYNGKSRKLPPFMAAAIDRNNRISHIEQFHPTTEAERDFLCKIYKVDRKDLISLSSERPSSYTNAVKQFRVIFEDESVQSVQAELHNDGFKVFNDGDTYYAINFYRHILINLNDEEFDVKRVKRQPRKQQVTKQQTKAKVKASVKTSPVPIAPQLQKLAMTLKNTNVGSQSANREWEVGQKKDTEEVERGRGMKW
ncbi:Mobilization nuclease domain protein [gut metagenome]|uniref:Mobilization nuclease domain protein n=1 Tax=gut metagenome TaxID=749906 RepID=J9G5Q6_9ZZZZ